MKKIVLFVLLMLPVAVFGRDYTWFDEPGEVIDIPSFKVFQVWSPSEALVRGVRTVKTVPVIQLIEKQKRSKRKKKKEY